MKKTAEIKTVAEKKSGLRFLKFEEIAGGFNCDVYKAVSVTGKSYFIKKYKENREFPSERLHREYDGLEFLWEGGVRQIPKPVVKIPDALIGIYEYIEGKPITPNEIQKHEVEKALHFWQSMNNVKISPDTRISNAKEAFFRISDYLANVDARLKMLSAVKHTEHTKTLHLFLESTVIPFFGRIVNLIPVSIRTEPDLPVRYRILSSSDFGFHNAIRRPDGTIIFHDFEYFGWDDPAKMISDFFIHPRMQFPNRYREDFYRKVYTVVKDPSLPRRLPYVYLILSVKWSLIMLNTYRDPETVTGKNKSYSEMQLAKAVGNISAVKKELEEQSFPIKLFKPS